MPGSPEPCSFDLHTVSMTCQPYFRQTTARVADVDGRSNVPLMGASSQIAIGSRTGVLTGVHPTCYMGTCLSRIPCKEFPMLQSRGRPLVGLPLLLMLNFALLAFSQNINQWCQYNDYTGALHSAASKACTPSQTTCMVRAHLRLCSRFFHLGVCSSAITCLLSADHRFILG